MFAQSITNPPLSFRSAVDLVSRMNAEQFYVFKGLVEFCYHPDGEQKTYTPEFEIAMGNLADQLRAEFRAMLPGAPKLN
jgi:hypothetical protein